MLQSPPAPQHALRRWDRIRNASPPSRASMASMHTPWAGKAVRALVTQRQFCILSSPLARKGQSRGQSARFIHLAPLQLGHGFYWDGVPGATSVVRHQHAAGGRSCRSNRAVRPDSRPGGRPGPLGEGLPTEQSLPSTSPPAWPIATLTSRSIKGLRPMTLSPVLHRKMQDQAGTSHPATV